MIIELYREHIHYVLDELKHSLGKHVFESFTYNGKLSDYNKILEQFRKVAGSHYY